MDPGHADERMSARQPLDAALVLGLELVVKLLADPLAHLRGERLDVQPGASRLTSGTQQRRVAQVGLDRFRHPGVLDLDGHSSPSTVVARWTWPIEAAANARSSKSREHALDRPAELLPHELLEVCERHRRDVVAQRGELALQLVLLVLGKAVELDHREHLADLHRRAAHLPKLVDELAARALPSARSGLPRPAPASAPGSRCASPPSAGPAPSPARRPAPSARAAPSAAFSPPAADRRPARSSTEPSDATSPSDPADVAELLEDMGNRRARVGAAIPRS